MIFYIFLAFINGVICVIAKMINYKCTKYLGTYGGSLINYVIGALSSLVFFIPTAFMSNYSFQNLTKVSWWLYLGGVFGLLSFIGTMITLKKLQVMESTILLLVGQLFAGVVFDCLLGRNFKIINIIGVILISLGLYLDIFSFGNN